MRATRTFRTEAIILKRRGFNESDRLLTLLTPGDGKLAAIAKGARKPTSPRASHVELFTRVDVLLAAGRDFHILTQSVTLDTYLPLREDLALGAYASYVAELADRFTMGGDEDTGPVYTLLAETLTRLTLHPDPALVARLFDLAILDLAGYRPELVHCVLTGQEVVPEDQFYSAQEGGVVSPAAAHRVRGLLPMRLDALKALRYLQRAPYERTSHLRLTPGQHQEIARLLAASIQVALERRPNSLDFIQQVQLLDRKE
jgi:DNA repair protein RecO (recombination protein O)